MLPWFIEHIITFLDTMNSLLFGLMYLMNIALLYDAIKFIYHVTLCDV